MKKLHLENARKLRGIYFIDPEDKEFKENIKNEKVGNISRSCYALLNYEKELWEWWIQQN